MYRNHPFQKINNQPTNKVIATYTAAINKCNKLYSVKIHFILHSDQLMKKIWSRIHTRISKRAQIYHQIKISPKIPQPIIATIQNPSQTFTSKTKFNHAQKEKPTNAHQHTLTTTNHTQRGDHNTQNNKILKHIGIHKINTTTYTIHLTTHTHTYPDHTPLHTVSRGIISNYAAHAPIQTTIMDLLYRNRLGTNPLHLHKLKPTHTRSDILCQISAKLV